jgi:hypothetical protein
MLLTLALFLAWCAVGLAGLVVLRADLSEMRVALTAPILGSALTVVPLFMLSNAGAPMETAAPPVLALLLVVSLVVLAWRRPRLSLAIAPVIALCLLDLALLGRPMLQYGFDWIANANGDMAYYVLSATHLVGDGLQSPVNVRALANNQDFPSSAQGLNLAGLRPGTQITLAGLAATTGKTPLALYMPISLAIAMSGICATASLAMQASRRWWSASVAAALLVASPMAGYGVLQQLLPQIWGVGLVAAVFSWLIRPEIHRNRGPGIADLCVISVLFVALFVVAYEVALTVIAAYVLYVGVLLARRRLSLRAVALLWAIPLVATIVSVNTFLPRAIRYIDHFVLSFGTSEGFKGISQFGYAIVPTALPGAIGLRSLFASPQAPYTSFFILIAAGVCAGVLVICVMTAARGVAAGIALVGYLALGILLARNGNDYGLFKLYMYSQPFLAAAIAVWLSYLRSKVTLAFAGAVLAVTVGLQIRTLNTYVNASFDPIDLPNASQPDLLPKFRLALERAATPVVTVTDNFTLGMLEGASAEDKRVFFLSRNLFDLPWKERVLNVRGPHGVTKLEFGENTGASRVLSRGSCVIVLPTGSQIAVNRRSLPEGSQNLAVQPCGRMNNALAFIVSSLGQPATLPEGRQWVSFWQLERDPWLAGRTFSGFGRYALFQVLNPSRSVRVALDFTTTPVLGGRVLPPVAVIGAERAQFPLVGSGSARVFSPALRPKIIGGQSYILLDMGRRGRLPLVRRPRAAGLWGKSAVLDPRSLTSYVRDVSLVGAREYRDLRPPLAIQSFPDDLRNGNLEYSGIYEDGWVGRKSYARLACGSPGRLVIRALVPARQEGQRLRVLVNGRLIESRSVMPGSLDLDMPLSACIGSRRVELRWAAVTRLGASDQRTTAVRLTFLGIV